MPTKAGLQSKIEHAGLGEKVADMLFNKKLTHRQIIDILKNEYDIELSEGSISNFRKHIIDLVPAFIERNQEYWDSLAKTYLNTIEEFIFLLKEINEKIKDYSPDPEAWKQHIAYIQLGIQQGYILMKKAGQIKPTQIIEKQEINTINFTQIFELQLVKLIDEKKIPLEACAPEIREMYRKAKDADS